MIRPFVTTNDHINVAASHDSVNP